MRLYLKCLFIASLSVLVLLGAYRRILSPSTDETMPTFSFTHDGAEIIGLDEREKRLIGSVLDLCCGSGEYLCKIAICSVILERYGNVGYPNDISSIIFSEPSFASFLNIDLSFTPTNESMSAIDDAIMGLSPCSEAIFFYKKGTSDIFLLKREIIMTIGDYIFTY